VNIGCRHCSDSWDLPLEFDQSLIEVITASRDTLSATGIKLFREHLNIPMMEAKRLLLHIATEGHTCFNCGSFLGENARVLTICANCGAINLDGDGV